MEKIDDWRELRDPVTGHLVATVDPSGRFLRLRKRNHHDCVIDLTDPAGPVVLTPTAAGISD